MKAFALVLPVLLLTGFAEERRDCEEPLAWRVGDVDPEFGIEPDEVARAVREAVAVWEGAAGRSLFRQDPEEGFPIHFVHDERHARVRERARRGRELAEMSARIDSAQAEVRRLGEQIEAERADHEERADAHAARLERYQDEVEYWNRRGGAPEEEMARLRRIEEELNQEARALNEDGEELSELVRRVNAETSRVNQEAEAYNQAMRDFREAFPPEGVRSGAYRESSRSIGSMVLSREREITVFQFDDREHLVRVLAHELGHALGLSHVGERDALMFVYADTRRPEADEIRLHERDIEELERVCGPGGNGAAQGRGSSSMP